MTKARDLSKLIGSSTFTVDSSNNIGLNSTSPVEKLNVVGVVSATSFFGDGTNLTGVSASRQLTIGVRVGSAVTFAISGNSFNVINRSGGNISIDV